MSYSLSEIIDIAITMEQTGHDFYRHCEKLFSRDNISDIFSFLAREELEHKMIFEKMKETIENSPGIYNEEYFSYLNAIGGKNIFDSAENNDDITALIKTPIDAIKRAFNDEKNSILLYSELRNLYKDDSSILSLLDRIIDEERKHVNTLVDISEKIKIAEQG